MKLRTLHLYGDLGKTYGRKHKVYAATIAEAIRIVECNHPGIARRVMMGKFHCLHGGSDLRRAKEMAEHQVALPRTNGDFHLVPVAAGAGGRTGKMIFSIIVGGALLFTAVGGFAGAAALASGTAGGSTLSLALTAAGGSGVLGLSAGTTALLGAGLLLGGLNMLLTPTPKTSTTNSNPTSFTFDGPTGTTDEGGAIPLIYGEVITAGVTIASDIRSGYGSQGYGGYGTPTTGLGYGGAFIPYDKNFSVNEAIY